MRRFLILGIGVLAGCASSQTVERPATTETVRVTGGGGGNVSLQMNATSSASVTALSFPAADVWGALPEVYNSFGIPLSTIDQTAKLIGNSGFNVRRRLGSVPLARLIDCGSTQGAPSADTYDVRLSVMTQVADDKAGGSTISTTVEAMGKPVALSGEYVRCSSSGSLESRIAEAVRQRLAK